MYSRLVFFALIALPVVEVVSIIWVASYIGWWALAWLATVFFVGIKLIHFERAAFAPRMLFTIQRGDNPMRALLASTRLFVAGGLLMFPGLITDILAVGLLLYPGTWKRPPMTYQGSARPAANDDIIEGEFSREQESPADRFPRQDT